MESGSPRRVLTGQDVWAGLLLASFGVAALLFGSDLPMGTARRMGPGYMPYGLAWLLILCAALIALRGLLAAEAQVERMRLRPFVGVLGGGLAFALLIGRGGILLASAGAIVGAALADRSTRWGEVAVLTVLAMAFCGVVFVKLLGLNIPLWFG
jgi:Tripartite tricarboxylate transporter TctB family